MGLHLDQPNTDGKIPSECDLGMGRRTYWNMWLWDKVVHAFFFLFSFLASSCVSPYSKTLNHQILSFRILKSYLSDERGQKKKILGNNRGRGNV